MPPLTIGLWPCTFPRRTQNPATIIWIVIVYSPFATLCLSSLMIPGSSALALPHHALSPPHLIRIQHPPSSMRPSPNDSRPNSGPLHAPPIRPMFPQADLHSPTIPLHIPHPTFLRLLQPSNPLLTAPPDSPSCLHTPTDPRLISSRLSPHAMIFHSQHPLAPHPRKSRSPAIRTITQDRDHSTESRAFSGCFASTLSGPRRQSNDQTPHRQG